MEVYLNVSTTNQKFVIPTCNRCGKTISWNKEIRANFGIKGPLEIDNSKPHKCMSTNEDQNNAITPIAPNIPTNNPTQTTVELPTNNVVQDPLLNTLALIPTSNEKIAEYLLTIVEQNKRNQDLQIKIIGQLENINYYLKKTHEDIILDQELSRKLYNKILNFDEILQSAQEKITEVEVIGDQEFHNGKPVFENASKSVRSDI